MRKYFIPGDVGSLGALYRRLFKKERPLPAFPRVVQIQTKTGCNARCVFCPNSIIGGRLPKGEMDWDLFKKIVDEIVQYPVSRISPYLMNEPLMDRRLPEMISYIVRNKRPETIVKINSNASLLDDEMAEGLIESGLDRINFSVHGIRKETYESQMVGLSLERVLQNIDNFLELKKRKGAQKPRVRVTMVKTKAIEEELEEILSYWKKRGVRVNIRPLENRARCEIADRGINPGKWKPFEWCNRLFEQAYILHDGRVVLCCVDWEQTTILGDLKRESLKDVWNSERYMDIRRRFLKGELKGLLCESCLRA